MSKKNDMETDLAPHARRRRHGWAALAAAMLSAPAITLAGPLLLSADVSITVNVSGQHTFQIKADESTATWQQNAASLSFASSLLTNPDTSPDIVLVSIMDIADDTNLSGRLDLRFDLTGTGYSLSLNCTPITQGGSCELGGPGPVTPSIEIALSNMVWDPAAVLTGVTLSGTSLFDTSSHRVASTSFGDNHYEVSFEELPMGTGAESGGTVNGTFLTRALPARVDEPAGVLLSATALVLLGVAGRRWRTRVARRA